MQLRTQPTTTAAIEPMSRLQFKKFANQPQIPNEQDVPGFKVTYYDEREPNHPELSEFYIEWISANVFSSVDHLVDYLDFGAALNLLTKGLRVSRRGWIGKGAWLSLSGDPHKGRKVPSDSFWSKHNAQYAKDNGGHAIVSPVITLKTATGEIVMGWTPDQQDLFARDWVIVS